MNFKVSILIALIVSLVTGLIGFLTLDFRKTDLVQNDQFYVGVYSDRDEGGLSDVELLSEKPVKFNYKISNEAQFPFAGIYFEDTLDGKKMDFSLYDQISIEIKAKSELNIPITFNALWNLKSRPYAALVKAGPEIQSFTLPFERFETPNWWLKEHDVKADTPQDFSKVLTLNVEDAMLMEAGVEDEIEVKSIVLSKDNSTTMIVLGALEVIGLLFAFLLPYFRPQKELVPIAASEVILQENEDPKNAITKTIGEQYANPDLVVRDVAKAIGIKESDVSRSLKTHFSMSFKEYLNYIRLTEAKRLLKETELNISEIAYTVGYNNVTHFNRVFKGKEGISPKEFRK